MLDSKLHSNLGIDEVIERLIPLLKQHQLSLNGRETITIVGKTHNLYEAAERAMLNYRHALMITGWAFIKGHVYPKNPSIGIDCFVLASTIRNPKTNDYDPETLYVCANYLERLGRSLDDSFQLMRYASKQGYYPATYRLAMKYYRGTGVLQDSQKSLELFKESARAGHIPSYRALADLYWRKKGLGNKLKASLYFIQCVFKAILALSKGKTRNSDELLR